MPHPVCQGLPQRRAPCPFRGLPRKTRDTALKFNQTFLPLLRVPKCEPSHAFRDLVNIPRVNTEVISKSTKPSLWRERVLEGLKALFSLHEFQR
jgi:hypothetical protein